MPESKRVFPVLTLSSRAISSRLAPIRSASFHSMRARSAAAIRGHGPWSNARRAAWTARSTSRSSPFATWALTSSVAGLMVAYVSPDAGGRHWPPMKTSLVCMAPS